MTHSTAVQAWARENDLSLHSTKQGFQPEFTV